MPAEAFTMLSIHTKLPQHNLQSVIGALLLLNLFKDRLNLPAEYGSKAPVK
ncbi:MAG: hypothetical protein QOF02_2597 [Blastocatellia bacterium]|jgi:hypothetical protein|nr:hypothetical protein [Blastocatellia bacterium]